jgi:hypothetical protein
MTQLLLFNEKRSNKIKYNLASINLSLEHSKRILPPPQKEYHPRFIASQTFLTLTRFI